MQRYFRPVDKCVRINAFSTYEYVHFSLCTCVHAYKNKNRTSQTNVTSQHCSCANGHRNIYAKKEKITDVTLIDYRHETLFKQTFSAAQENRKKCFKTDEENNCQTISMGSG